MMFKHTVKKLYFSPVKSLSFSEAKKIIIKKNTGIKNDRIFAFTRIISKKESVYFEKYPNKRNGNFFLKLLNSPFLNKYNFEFRNKELSMLLNNKVIKKATINNNNNYYESFSRDFMTREKLITKTPHLIYNKAFPFFDTTPTNTISLVNLTSIKDFENKIDRKIEHERFRANIYIESADPWVEFNWINMKIIIGNCQFKVLNKIPRCSATNLAINSQNEDINLPLQLRYTFDHRNMGIYITPLTDGEVEIGDTLNL